MNLDNMTVDDGTENNKYVNRFIVLTFPIHRVGVALEDFKNLTMGEFVARHLANIRMAYFDEIVSFKELVELFDKASKVASLTGNYKEQMILIDLLGDFISDVEENLELTPELAEALGSFRSALYKTLSTEEYKELKSRLFKTNHIGSFLRQHQPQILQAYKEGRISIDDLETIVDGSTTIARNLNNLLPSYPQISILNGVIDGIKVEQNRTHSSIAAIPEG